jgi:hypothetical protein
MDWVVFLFRFGFSRLKIGTNTHFSPTRERMFHVSRTNSTAVYEKAFDLYALSKKNVPMKHRSEGRVVSTQGLGQHGSIIG